MKKHVLVLALVLCISAPLVQADEEYNITYLGKNNQTKVLQEVAFGPFSLSHDFLIKASTGNYIPATENTYFSQILSLFNGAINNNGFFEAHWSQAFVVGVSISISGNIFYEP